MAVQTKYIPPAADRNYKVDEQVLVYSEKRNGLDH